MISPQNAWDILSREISPLESQRIPLADAHGAFLAESVVADRDIPPSDRAAMDGYALRATDLASLPARLTVDCEVAAGSPTSPAIGIGHCVRIFTGANIPPDADTVVPVEQTSTRSFRDRPADAWIEIAVSVRPGANIFRRGENAYAGHLLLTAGTKLGPRQIGIAAATGYGFIAVHRRPRVHILTTGEELLEAEQPAAPHQVRNSNGPMLLAALHEAGFAGVKRSTVPDAPGDTAEAIRQTLAQVDAVILTGGISAGLHDYVSQAIADAGATIHYQGVAMKPGKPQLFASTTGGQYLFGLPGNPLSSIVVLYELVLPALRRLAGCPIEDCRFLLYLPLAAPARNNGDRFQVIPAVLNVGPGGTHVRPQPPVGSADLVTGGQAEGAILLPPSVGSLPAGTIVQFRPWGGLGA